MKQSLSLILLNFLPILVMIGLIAVIPNDYVLLAVYASIICVSFILHYEKHELLIFFFGVIGMSISEYVFLATGVEIFLRNSLFGMMPIWLPVLWGYAFVVIKRDVKILDI